MIKEEEGLVSLFNVLLETMYHGLPASGAPTGLVLFRSLSTRGGSHLAHESNPSRTPSKGVIFRNSR